ncbi:hypothetical protein GQ55_1G079600 [Panicum hallii var. hallii]|uniref:Uncharacterized protein n=1 Tax=Panicum hallii var. hallii TaxID=1504633 RepID=A0A2T7F3H2_9POAL|nr:hypothetical protein GQ55_1G079600 [Panicum hallii var. hallii]
MELHAHHDINEGLFPAKCRIFFFHSEERVLASESICFPFSFTAAIPDTAFTERRSDRSLHVKIPGIPGRDCKRIPARQGCTVHSSKSKCLGWRRRAVSQGQDHQAPMRATFVVIDLTR